MDLSPSPSPEARGDFVAGVGGGVSGFALCAEGFFHLFEGLFVADAFEDLPDTVAPFEGGARGPHVLVVEVFFDFGKEGEEVEHVLWFGENDHQKIMVHAVVEAVFGEVVVLKDVSCLEFEFFADVARNREKECFVFDLYEFDHFEVLVLYVSLDIEACGVFGAFLMLEPSLRQWKTEGVFACAFPWVGYQYVALRRIHDTKIVGFGKREKLWDKFLGA